MRVGQALADWAVRDALMVWVTSLELAHGEDPWDEASTQVRVEMRLPRRVFEDDEVNVEIERADLAAGLSSRRGS